MIKSIAKKIIALYLLPFRSETQLFYYVRDVFFSSGSEHLHRAVRLIEAKVGKNAGSVIVDVGGADGSTALFFAENFRDAKVFCIEPNTQMAAKLESIAEQQKSITVKNIALGSRSGEAILHVTSNNVSSSLNELNTAEIEQYPATYQGWLKEEAAIKVKVSTLDEEFKNFEDILLVKLDTQGSELEILRGGEETLRRTRFVLTEMNNHRVYKNACQYYEVDAFLRDHSFKLIDMVVSYRAVSGVEEYDALYERI